MTYIKDELCKLASSDMYPLHMPGHKRRLDCDINPYTYDITEIDGFDNLHAAEGIIKEAEERAAALWGAKSSFFLVNGSTCGILAALSAALPKKGHLLMARNSHKAAYHAAYLRELQVTYLYPVFTEFGIQGGILPEQVEAALEADESIEAVFLTSPTYDGIVSDSRNCPSAWDSADCGRSSWCASWLSSVFPKISYYAGSRCGNPEPA